MGAHTFETRCRGKSAKDAFQMACNEANYEEGHNAYNGTISTNDSFIMKPLLEDENLNDWYQRVPEDEGIRKWGPCGCVQDPKDPELWHFAGWAAC